MRAGAVRWYCPRAKDGKRQKPCKHRVCKAFKCLLRSDIIYNQWAFGRCDSQLIFIYGALMPFFDSLKETVGQADCFLLFKYYFAVQILFCVFNEEFDFSVYTLLSCFLKRLDNRKYMGLRLAVKLFAVIA